MAGDMISLRKLLRLWEEELGFTKRTTFSLERKMNNPFAYLSLWLNVLFCENDIKKSYNTTNVETHRDEI